MGHLYPEINGVTIEVRRESIIVYVPNWDDRDPAPEFLKKDLKTLMLILNKYPEATEESK